MLAYEKYVKKDVSHMADFLRVSLKNRRQLKVLRRQYENNLNIKKVSVLAICLYNKYVFTKDNVFS